VRVGNVPRADQDEDTVDPQPPQREGERVQRRRVRPLGVVDHHDNRAVLLQHPKQVQQARADGERISLLPATASRRGKRLGKRQVHLGEQLVDDPERQGCLLLGAAALQRPNPGILEEPVDQRGLADPGRPLDQDQPGKASPGGIQRGQQPTKLHFAADEPIARNRCGGRGWEHGL
jgi:hypothetical protein